MIFTVDTAGATAFELTILARTFDQLAAGANGYPDNSSAAPAIPVAPAAPAAGNDAPTVIPQAPASATGSDAPSLAPAVPSGTPADSASGAPAVPNVGPLDKAGRPWDPRINTANKGTIGDGTWRKKPGVAPELVAAVHAEQDAAKQSGAATGSSTGAPPLPSDAPAVPTAPALTGDMVLARCTEIQMADMSKGTALFQAIVGAGIIGGPAALPGTTDVALLQACLDAVNKV